MTIRPNGSPTTTDRGHMIEMTHRRVAPWRAADALVTDSQQVGEPVAEEPLLAGRTDQVAGARGVDGTQPRGVEVQTVGDQVPRHLRRDGAMPCARTVQHDGGLVPTGQQRLIGHDEMHRDRNVCGALLARDALDQGQRALVGG